ncbi:hypothetical protein HMPREF9194_00364 [Treponema maltophilum ATCC 51939]|uniref:Uncharacterized protein n=1 Tax=Treponema maltophilum ATCC 51939 TaxID=1125699 RepID=S3K5W1_TREMA|nr:hypothetical protein HMPREF9194_00364 [Treponema maltophilum ATCC 51939]
MRVRIIREYTKAEKSVKKSRIRQKAYRFLTDPALCSHSRLNADGKSFYIFFKLFSKTSNWAANSLGKWLPNFG